MFNISIDSCYNHDAELFIRECQLHDVIHQPVVEFIDLVEKNPQYFTSEKCNKIKNIIRDDNSKLSLIVKYLNGTENNDTRIEEAVNLLVNVEKAVNPSISDKDAIISVIFARTHRK